MVHALLDFGLPPKTSSPVHPTYVRTRDVVLDEILQETQPTYSTLILISLLARVVAKILATKVRRFFFNRRTIPTVASTVCIEKPTYFSKKREREKKNSKKGGSKKTSPAKLIS